jgi:4-hydroxy-tetrahydrodipicolinate synthase
LPPIEGVYAAIVTPRRPDRNQVDLGAALELIDFVSRGGVDGIVLSGSTGEFTHFDVEDRLHLAQFAIRRSRVPVIVNVSHSSFDGALTLARGAASFGAAALLLLPPYFFRYSQDDVKEFYVRLAREAGPDTPILLYSVPAFGAGLDFETATSLLATGLFAGIKDSSGNAVDLHRLLEFRERVPFTLLAGHDAVFAEARAGGANGVVSGTAGVIPELVTRLDRAVRATDRAKCDRLQARLLEFVAWIERLPFPLALKEALTERGLKAGPPGSPPGKTTSEKAVEFREWFRGWLPDVLKEAAQ